MLEAIKCSGGASRPFVFLGGNKRPCPQHRDSSCANISLLPRKMCSRETYWSWLGLIGLPATLMILMLPPYDIFGQELVAGDPDPGK
ncbi:hypothetical protein E2C01_058487 [Portunus trituberculatus]|uniref:Uncharacterized protein n=1 Tax=Portunus trituberculatus TaxID=210409 RepID=A0A5B7H2S6_PORTR|nr:hypothetical protein [Portunus trituberculatus]